MVARLFALVMLVAAGPDAARQQDVGARLAGSCGGQGDRCPGSDGLKLAALEVQPSRPAATSEPIRSGCEATPLSATCRPLIGINLAPPNNDSTELPFLDFMKLAGQPIANGKPPAADERDADGWPRAMPANGAQWQWAIPLEAAPNTYVLLYDGSAAVSVYDARANQGNAIGWNAVQIGSFSRGRITFRSSGAAANFAITHLDPAAPIRNIRIVRADREKLLTGGALFNPDFVAFARKFSVIRTMDWNCINGSTRVTWAERSKTTEASWVCVPLEAQIAAANAAGVDLWLNIPALADDDFIRRAVGLAHDRLDPGRKLHLEYSNEVWNRSFAQSTSAQAQADRRWGKALPWGHEAYYGYRSAQMAKIAHDVYGADADRGLSPVLATFTAWGNGEVDDAIQLGVAKAGLGQIGSLFKEYAVTTYFGDALGFYPGNEADRPIILGWAKSGAAGIDNAFRQLEHGGLLKADNSLDSLKRTYAIRAERARKWGLQMVAYEGGLSWTYFAAPEKGVFDQFFDRIMADPRMKILTARMITDFGAAGGKELTQFNDIGRNGQFGPWAMQPNLMTSTPRSEALMEASRR